MSVGTSRNASSRAYLRNVVLGYVATAASLLAGLVVTPLLYRRLGSAEFGVFSLVISTAGIALLADLGVSTTTIRRVADAVAVADAALLARSVRASRLLLRGSSLLTFAALCAVAWWGPAAFGLSHHAAAEFRVSMLVVAAGNAILVGVSTTTAVVIGYGRADLFAARSTVLGLATASGQAAAALAGWGVVGVCSVVAASAVVSAAIGIQLQRRLLGGRLAAAAVSPSQLWDTVREGGANLALAVLGTIAFAADTVVLGALAPLAAVTAYAVAQRVPGLIRSVCGRAIDLLTPAVSHANAAEPERLLSILFRSSVFSTAMAGAVTLAISPSLSWLLHLWLGVTPRHTVETATLLGIALVVQLPTLAIASFLTGLRRLTRLLWFELGSTTANLALTIGLAPHLGALGPALASATCVLAGDLLIVPLVAAPVLGVGSGQLFARTTVPALLPALPASLVAWLLWLATSGPATLVAGAAGGATYCLLFWLLLSPDDRRWAVGMVTGMLRRQPRAAT